MEDSGAVETVIDLSHLEFIDSSGMATLVEAGRRFQADGRQLRILGQPKRFATIEIGKAWPLALGLDQYRAPAVRRSVSAECSLSPRVGSNRAGYPTCRLHYFGHIRVSQVGGRRGDRFISPSVQREEIVVWTRRDRAAARRSRGLAARRGVQSDGNGVRLLGDPKSRRLRAVGRGVGLEYRGQKKIWSKERVERELVEFVAGRERFPTVREFELEGRGKLYGAAKRHVGVPYCVDRAGPRLPNTPRHSAPERGRSRGRHPNCSHRLRPAAGKREAEAESWVGPRVPGHRRRRRWPGPRWWSSCERLESGAGKPPMARGSIVNHESSNHAQCRYRGACDARGRGA